MPIDPAHFVAYAALNAYEQMRVDDCFVSGAYEAGTYFVVFSRNPVLYHVLGVWPQAEEQQAVNAMNAADLGDEQNWTAADKAAVVYTQADYAGMRLGPAPAFAISTMFVVEHPCWTEQSVALFSKASAAALQRGLALKEVESIELRIRIKHGADLRYELGPKTDAIFLTPGAWNIFAAPHYRQKFGQPYVDALWRYLTQTMTRLLDASGRRAPDR